MATSATNAVAAPVALVMGDIDLVRALGLAGIPVAFFGLPDASARFSRHVRVVLPWIDHWRNQDELVAALMAFGRAQREAPVLFPQTDAALLLASRHREELGTAFRLMLADAELIEDLVDKGRFQTLACRDDLPVPRSERLCPHPGQPPPALGLSFPLIVKPVVRGIAWGSLGAGGKAMHVGGPQDWAEIWPRLADARSEVVVQELVAGPESAVESYHSYIDESGAIAGEFTGRKIRTSPPRYGYSTAVEVTELPDVAQLGRKVLDRIGMRGVAKVDFKRDERGRLHLLEINPRFNLWHHPAAIAGVNLPALVHADLTGRPRPPGRRATRRVAWCMPLWDARTAYAAGVSPLKWLRWARGCEAMSGLSRDDPLPFIRGSLASAVRRRLPRRGAPA
jgi:predicted ATP-grasp superfamily ATP-dependent carboligase